MINMGYCRQENTYRALMEAFNDVDAHINEEAKYPVSEREIGYFKQIIGLAYDFMCGAELLTDEGELDESALENVCDLMRYGNGED